MGEPNPRSAVKINFQGHIHVPEGTATPLDLKELVIAEDAVQALFREFNETIKSGTGFVTTISISGDDRAITIRFSHVGHTAAFFMLSYDVNDEPRHIHSLTALLPKLDAAEDRQAIDIVRDHAVLGGIKREAFDKALEVDYPVAASFFADGGSANYPPLHSIIRVLSAAFFGQFGIGSD